ncbi:M20/M25/M40 family metallo-hydrolase [Acidaminobacterium chupaoyuni]
MRTIEKLMQQNAVKEALDFLKQDTEATLKEQLEIVQIPAPSNDEGERTVDFARRLEAMGYQTVTDAVGNVYTMIEGSDPNGPTLMLAGHLDTVFPRTQPLKVTEENGIYRCPGICDDTRAVAEVLSIARAFKKTGIRPAGNILLCGNVGEEGLGNLRGVKELFKNLKIDAFISLDHWGLEDILIDATGSKRYKITYRAEGGHSFGAFGKPNPIHAMGRAINSISQLHGLKEPKTTFNVGVVSGGTSINSIPCEASMLVDIRSNSAEELAKLEATILEMAKAAATAETEHWQDDDSVKITLELIGDRPAGSQPHDGLMVQTFGEVLSVFGKKPHVTDAGSTDCNVPVSLGVPAAVLAYGGTGGDCHNPHEWYQPDPNYPGPAHTLLMLLMLAGMKDVNEPLISKR